MPALDRGDWGTVSKYLYSTHIPKELVGCLHVCADDYAREQGASGLTNARDH